MKNAIISDNKGRYLNIADENFSKPYFLDKYISEKNVVKSLIKKIISSIKLSLNGYLGEYFYGSTNNF